MEPDDFRAVMKATHWEQAKGHMRAMVAIDGSVSSERPIAGEKFRFQEVSDRIERFITDFENEGMHE